MSHQSESRAQTRLIAFQGTQMSPSVKPPLPPEAAARPAYQGRWRIPRGEVQNDTQTDMLPGIPGSAIRVRRFDDSLNSAIHITYRILLRSSSMHEPRDPPLKVVSCFVCRSLPLARVSQPDKRGLGQS